MTTTELIELLQKVEKGASGRSREISLYIGIGCEAAFIPERDIFVDSTGDGIGGAEVALRVQEKE